MSGQGSVETGYQGMVIMAAYSHLDGVQTVIINDRIMFAFMQIIISAAAAAVSTLIHCSYGKIVSMGTSWIS